ncbi:MAG: serine/threonine-protein phosphatase, partial [Clostridia bacterium]|nr:serine/threonine-protein phosphatase [Clostridia bacterium]
MAATLRTHVGRIRRQNEDAAWLDEARGVFAIADGMGGHLAGEVASKMAIDAVMAATEGERTAGVSVLRAAAERAHEAILAHAEMHPECSGMGTTLSVMWRGGRYMYIAHVGDSRIYRLRGGKLEQITEDHSLVEELVRAKIITREEA